MKGENLSVKPQSEMEMIESHRNVAPLQFFLFGAPQILLNGDSLIPEISRRAQALLYYLAVTPALQQRSRLASLFWPDVPDVQARKNLRNIVPELRKHLDPFLYITQEVIGFKDRTAIWVDVDLLQRAFADSGTRSKPGQLLAVAHFYRGDFLEGFFVANAPFYEEWITARREQCRHIVVDGLYQSAQQLLESREIGLGMQVARRLLEIERWHEAAHRLIMQFLMLDGQRAAALMHYQRLHTLLLSELGIEPDEVTEALHEELRTVTRPVSSTLSRAYIEVPISVALTQSKHNLLQPTLRLIGRQAEIDLICEKLAEENCRLLTLLGETGVGKSKLAYAAAQRIIDSNLTVSRAKIFPDGVWFVPLSAMTTSSPGSAPGLRNDLAVAIACAMKHQFVGSQPLFRQLLLFLRHKATLLILDGIEQLLPEFSACCLEILQASPQIVLLVTATHPLHLATESIFPTPRLALPSLTEEAYLPLSSLSVFSGIDLFLKRAQWLLPSYQLTAANRHDLLQLCRWADGLPAVLEVLAALSVSFTPAQLVAALQEQQAATFAVDAGPGDSALADPEKPIWQGRLLALLNCAWEVLTLTEQQAVLACSVFPDSFLIDAASIVVQVPTTTLVALEQKTFLRRNGQRFMLNHLFRSYVDEKRLQSGTEKRFLRNHSVYYLNQLSTQSAAPKDDPLPLEWFRNELANIRVAWQWAASHDETVLLEKALAMVIDCYRRVGYLEELVVRLDEAISAVRQQLINQTLGTADFLYAFLGRLLTEQAYFCSLIGRYEIAATLALEGAEIGEQLNIAEIAGSCHFSLSLIAEKNGNIAESHKAARTALTWAKSGQQLPLEVRCLNMVGRTLIYLDDAKGALTYYQRSLKLAQASDPFLESAVLGDISMAYLCLGEYEQAQSNLEQALTLSRSGNFAGANAWAHLLDGERALRVGQFEHAQRCFDRALVIYTGIGLPLQECMLRQRLSRLFALQKDYTAAVRNGEEAIRISLHYHLPLWQPAVFASCGHALIGLNRLAEAQTVFAQSLAAAQKLQSRGEIILAQTALAHLSLLRQEREAALLQIETHLPLPALITRQINSEPGYIWLTSYQILAANNDSRAARILQQAGQWLGEQAAKLKDETLRRSFAENIPTHLALRKLLQAGQSEAANPHDFYSKA